MKNKYIAFVSAILLSVAVSSAFGYMSKYPKGLTMVSPSQVNPGYVVFTARDGKAYLVSKQDPTGRPIHSWVSPDPDRPGMGYSEPLENGHILAFLSTNFTPGCGENCGSKVVEMNFDGNVVWEYIDEVNFLHHDFQRLENGNTLLLCSVVLDRPEISPIPIVDDCLIEVDPAGQIVWQWQTADHFDEFEFTDEAKALIAATDADWMHANAIWSITSDTSHTDPRFAPGNIIISYRDSNFIIIVDRNTGEIVWKTNSMTVGQHDTQMIPDGFDGAGNILVFDNGGGGGYPTIARQNSRIREIDPVTMAVPYEYDARDSGRAVWSFFSHFVSAVQRLPNGNTFICEGSTGRLFEVTPAGTIVWEWISPIFAPIGQQNELSSHIYRAKFVPLDWVPAL